MITPGHKALAIFGTLLLSVISAKFTPALAASNQTLSYDTTLTAIGSNGTAGTSIAVPRGQSPLSISGVVTPEVPAAGSVLVHAGTSQVTLSADRGGAFTLPVNKAMLENGRLSISLTNQLTDESQTCRFNTTASETLAHLTLKVAGEPSIPTSIDEFFTSDVRSIGVLVPNSTNAQVNQAALIATAALAHRYDRSTSIEVLTAGDYSSRPRAFDRLVSLKPTTAADAQVRLGKTVPPTLTIEGDGTALALASAALGSNNLALANKPVASKLLQQGQGAITPTLTLSELGAVPLTLQGWGRTTAFISVPQSAFGSPIDAVNIHLVGVHTPVAVHDQVTMSVLWNGQLVASQSLALGDDYTANVTVDSTQIRRDNGLTLQLDGLPYNGNCEHNVQQARVDINAKASSISASRGQSLPVGFERFPQTLGQDIPVAFGSGAVSDSELTSAGHLVSSLQRASAIPLAVRVVDFADFLSASYPGLVVGANPADADELGATLRLHPWRTVPEGGNTFSVTVDGAFAALEAFNVAGRDVLMLGSTDGVEASTLASSLASYADKDPAGWYAITSDLLIALPDKNPVTLAASLIVPQSEVTAEFSTLPVWILLALLVILAAIATRIFIMRRRSRTISILIDSLDDPETNVSAGGSEPK